MVYSEQDEHLVLNPVLIKIEDDLQEESTAGPSEPTVTSNQVAMSAFKPRKRKCNVTVDDYLEAGKNNPKARFKGGKDIILARYDVLNRSWETISRISGSIATNPEVIGSGGYRDARRSLVTLKEGGQMDVVTKTYNDSGLARLNQNCDEGELPKIKAEMKRIIQGNAQRTRSEAE